MTLRYHTPTFTQVRYVLPDKDEQLLRQGQLSENFRLSEFTRSATARRLGLNNTPPPEAIVGLNALVDNVLQPARDDLGVALRITSGYRSPELNRAVKGAKRSDHVKGWAADVETVPETARDMRRLGEFIKHACVFKQLIWEFGGEWIHVSYDPTERANDCEVLEAYYDSAGRTRYRKFSF